MVSEQKAYGMWANCRNCNSWTRFNVPWGEDAESFIKCKPCAYCGCKLPYRPLVVNTQRHKELTNAN